ncbi:unnamed protein product [Trichobilharzia regenti]|nr:unnamed protein product [Trichobilharzia regenti]
MDQNSKEIRRQRRIKHDEMKIMKMKQRLYTLGGRSTFHGIDVLLEAKPGWSRRLTILILITMCVACFFTVSDLIAGFINMPISTVINYGQKSFEFPTVNICPDSPMSIERLKKHPDLRKKYLQIAAYWIAKASGDNSKWPPTNGDWRIRAKRTFRPHFLYNRTRLMWKWSDYFVSCEYGGTPCNIDEVSVDIPLGVMSHANTLLLGTEGVAKLNVVPRGLVKAVSSNVEENDLPSMWFNGKPIIQEENTAPKNWSTGRVILIDHPSKYICFQITMNNTMVREPGSIKGLHLVLRRPYNRKTTQPALLTVESKPSILQAWDDRLFLSDESSDKKSYDIKNVHKFDGFHIMLHGNKGDGYAGDLPADEIFKAGSARSIVSFGLRYGQHVSVGVSQYVSCSINL